MRMPIIETEHDFTYSYHTHLHSTKHSIIHSAIISYTCTTVTVSNPGELTILLAVS